MCFPLWQGKTMFLNLFVADFQILKTRDYLLSCLIASSVRSHRPEFCHAHLPKSIYLLRKKSLRKSYEDHPSTHLDPEQCRGCPVPTTTPSGTKTQRVTPFLFSFPTQAVGKNCRQKPAKGSERSSSNTQDLWMCWTFSVLFWLAVFSDQLHCPPSVSSSQLHPTLYPFISSSVSLVPLASFRSGYLLLRKHSSPPPPQQKLWK